MTKWSKMIWVFLLRHILHLTRAHWIHVSTGPPAAGVFPSTIGGLIPDSDGFGFKHMLVLMHLKSMCIFIRKKVNFLTRTHGHPVQPLIITSFVLRMYC